MKWLSFRHSSFNIRYSLFASDIQYLKATPLAATDVDEFADGVIDEPDDELPPLPKEIDGDFFIDLIRNLCAIAKVTLLIAM